MINSGSNKSSLWLLLLLFLVAVGPLALDFNFYYPDEVHYSDAAIAMVKSGDYLTPTTANGDFRFNKPVFTYWVLAASYQLLGIHPFSTRVLFLLAGLLLIIVVYRLALLVAKNKVTALLAALICATHVTFIMSSMRAIPDILLALFITLSAYGVAGMMQPGKRGSTKFLWYFYLGLALAFEVKGLPAVVFGFVSLLFLLLNPWHRFYVKQLVHWPSLLVAVALGSFWPVAMYIKHGDLFLNSFYADQVGVRFSFDLLKSLSNLLMAAVLFVALFFPWNLLLIKQKGRFDSLDKGQAVFLKFAFTWALTMVLLSVFLNPFYERYLLPVIPVGAVALALLISRSTNINLVVFRLVQTLIFTIGLVLWGLSLLLQWKIEFNWLLSLLICLLLGVLAYFTVKAFQRGVNFMRFGLSLLILPLLMWFITQQISFPNDGHQIANAITKQQLDKTVRIGFVGNFEVASKARVHLKGAYSLVNIDSLTVSSFNKFDVLIGNNSLKELADQQQLTISPVAVFWEEIPVADLLKNIFEGNYYAYKLHHASTYYWVEPKSSLMEK
jgi:4-amino-4-deoxy-L-arabinose transferase-like glycosyltransferase